MNERLVPGAPVADDTEERAVTRAGDADVIDAEIVDEPAPRSIVAEPLPVADPLLDPSQAPRHPRSSRNAEPRPARSDFLSWRSAMTGAAAGPADRRLPWPRLLGFFAVALLFVALVSLIVLVAL